MEFGLFWTKWTARNRARGVRIIEVSVRRGSTFQYDVIKKFEKKNDRKKQKDPKKERKQKHIAPGENRTQAAGVRGPQVHE